MDRRGGGGGRGRVPRLTGGAPPYHPAGEAAGLAAGAVALAAALGWLLYGVDELAGMILGGAAALF